MNQNLVGDVSVPCIEPHDPHTMPDEEALEVLKDMCPSLFSGSPDPLLCCSPEQVYEMENSFRIPDQLGLSRCPSCQYNFRLLFCEVTCSPHQADFTEVVNTSLTADNRQMSVAVQIHVPESFPNRLHESCSGVQGLVPGQFILDLMCGSWGAAQCNGQRWLQFLGLSIENDGQAPHQMDFVYYKEDKAGNKKDGSAIIPMSDQSVECWQKAPGSSLPCSCNDCEATCALKELPAEARFLPSDADAMRLIGMSGTEVLSVLLFLFLLSLILTYFVLKAYYKKRTQNRKCRLLIRPTPHQPSR